MNQKEFKVNSTQTIDEVFAKINGLNAKKESAQGDANSKFEESLKDLETKKEDLEAKYVELENASEKKWDEIKNAFSSASYFVKDELAKITSLFFKLPEKASLLLFIYTN